MLQERRNHILQKVTENGKVRVADLSRELNCSEVTIRNDIKNMDQQGLLQRTHGGAVFTGIPREKERLQRVHMSI